MMRILPVPVLTCVLLSVSFLNANAQTVQIQSKGRIQLTNGGRVEAGMGNSQVDSGGTLDLEPATNAAVYFSLGQFRTLTVNGTLEMLRASGGSQDSIINGVAIGDDISVLNGENSGVTIGSTGTINAQNYQFPHIDGSGIVISNGATIRNLNDGTINNQSSAPHGPLLDLAAVTGAYRDNIPRSIKGVTMTGSATSNIKSGSRTPPVYFYGYAGAMSGETLDSDDHDRIHWITSIVRNVTTSTNYDTLAAAASAAVADDVIRGNKNVPINENVTLTVNCVLENMTMVAHNGSAAVAGGTGTVRNCVITGGGLNVSRVWNCTIFRVGTTGSYTVTAGISITNCLVESSGWTLSGSQVTTTTTATASYFAWPSALDFHAYDVDFAVLGGTDMSDSATHPYTTDFEMQTRSTWQRGADHFLINNNGSYYFTSNVTDATLGFTAGQVANIGKINRIQTYRNVSGAQWRAYVFAGGGGGDVDRDYRIYVVRYDTAQILYWSDALAGPVVNFVTYTVTSGSEYRIFVVVDANADGFGDGIQALTDSGSALTLDPDEDPGVGVLKFGAADGTDDGVNYPGGTTGGKLTWLKIHRLLGEEDVGEDTGSQKTARRLYFVKELSGATAGQGTLYKMNADPNDLTDNTNQDYGEVIWNNTTTKKYTYKAPVQFSTNGSSKMFISLSLDTTEGVNAERLVERFSMSGNTEPSVDAYWVAPDTVVDENDMGVTLGSVVTGGWHVYTNPSDDTRMYSFADTAATDVKRYTTVALGDATGNCNTSAFRFAGTEYVLLGVGNRLEKIKDNVGSGSPNGDRVSGEASGIFPKTITGTIVQWVLRWGTSIYWGTNEGYIYESKWRYLISQTYAETSDLTGFPYVLPGRITWTFFMPTTDAAGGLYVGTDQGSIIKVPLN